MPTIQQVHPSITLESRIHAQLPIPKGQTLRVIKISPHVFRANWWAPVITDNENAIIIASRIEKSRVLKVETRDGALLILDITK